MLIYILVILVLLNLTSKKMRTLFICFSFIVAFTDMVSGQEGINDALLLEYYQTQRYADAASYLTQFYQADSTNSKLIGNLAYCYRMAGNAVKAEHFYQILFEKDTTDIKTLLNLGSINQQRGLNQRAIAYYRKILTLDSNHMASYKALSDLTLMEGQTSTSYDYLRKANRLDPHDPDIAYDLADLSIGMKQYQFADSILGLALTADRENMLLLKLKVQARYGMRDFLRTIAIGDSLRVMGDESDILLGTLAPAYYFVKDYAKCIEVLKFMEERGSDLKEAQLYFMAMSYKKLNKLKEAVEYFRQTINSAISPNVANYYFEKADVHERLKQNKTAIWSYQKSLQFANIPMTYYSLALIYDRQLNNHKQALRYYKLYLDQKPDIKKEQAYITYVKQRIAELQMH